MLRNFTRLPLRRLAHMQATSARRSSRYGLAIGASVTAATFMAWSLATERQRIALDDRPVSASKKFTPDSVIVESSVTVEPHSSQTDSSSSPFVDESGPEDSQPPQAEGENEDAGGGAYNPETGEINWDCPCLGGMAHGPCGQEFREAFACFVHSNDEPKGMDCVEKFKAMQNCFREHPDVYGEEIMDDDEETPEGQAQNEESGHSPEVEPSVKAAEPALAPQSTS